MLRSLAGFKAQYDDLTMLVVSEFDEWRVVVHSPAVVLQGQRQYGEAKAKEHAVALVKRYIEEATAGESGRTASAGLATHRAAGLVGLEVRPRLVPESIIEVCSSGIPPQR